MTVRELLTRMDSRELAEWMAYYEIEPFGEERADMRAGIVASTIANRHRGKNEKVYKPTDFLPTFDQPTKAQQTWEEQLAVVQDLTKVFGGTITTKRGG